MIGVMVEVEGAAVRHYFAVGQADRARAEWAAVDHALRVGPVSPSPVAGQEPVEALRELTPASARTLGLADGEIRALGWKWPRRWMTA